MYGLELSPEERLKLKAKAKAQAWAFMLTGTLAVVVATPFAIRGILEGRIKSEGGCHDARYDFFSVWRTLTESRVGGCLISDDRYHNAWILKNQTLAVVILMIIALAVGACMVYKYGPLAAGDVASGVGQAFIYAVIIFGIAAAALVLFMLYVFFVTCMIVMAVLFAWGLLSTRD